MIAVRLGELYRSIHDVTTQLERRAFDKPLPSAKPRVNRVFRRWLNAWTPQRQGGRRRPCATSQVCETMIPSCSAGTAASCVSSDSRTVTHPPSDCGSSWAPDRGVHSVIACAPEDS